MALADITRFLRTRVQLYLAKVSTSILVKHELEAARGPEFSSNKEEASAMKTLFVSHETYSRNFWQQHPGESLAENFFDGAKWLSVPNSTVRLAATNLMAIKELQKEGLHIDVRFDEAWVDDLKEIYLQYDLVIVNAIPRVTSIHFALEVSEWVSRAGDDAPFLILGTEVTWESLLKKGEITQDQFTRLYTEFLILRHTSRTDKTLISDGLLPLAKVQEFEIGFDENVFPTPPPIDERRQILFVRAPEGRKTKNNEGIDQMIDLIESDSELAERFDLVQLEPPYSVLDYWAQLTKSAFLIFTSLGETFSYALNDAKAMGTVTLYPQQMYATTIGWKYAIDGYPKLGLKYSSNSEAVRLIREVGLNNERLELESARSRSTASSLFGLEVITDNWRKLILSESLNTESLLIYKSESCTRDDASQLAQSVGASFALPYLNIGYAPPNKISDFDDQRGIAHLRYPTSFDGEEFSRWIEVDGGRVSVGSGRTIKNEDLSTGLDFIRLALRSYKINRLVVQEDLKDTDLGNALETLQYYHSWQRGLIPVTIEWF